MAFEKRGEIDKSRTWKQVKQIESEAFSFAAGVYHTRLQEHEDPNDLYRRDALSSAASRAAVDADLGLPSGKRNPLLDRLHAHRVQRRKDEGGHEL